MLTESVWPGLPECAFSRHGGKPRHRGLTSVLDKHLGLKGFRDLLDVAGLYIDVVKFTSMTSGLYPVALLREKIEMLRNASIEACPGGTCAEFMLWKGVYREYLARARELGFTGMEISAGTIDLSPEQRDKAIGLALDAGFRVFSEVGRKEWAPQTGLEDLVNDVKRDLSSGSNFVIIEAMEGGQGVGIMDAEGNPSKKALEALLQAAGGPERIIFEAPLRRQQELFIDAIGPDVNLGNIPSQEVLVVEATRREGTGIPFMSSWLRDQRA